MIWEKYPPWNMWQFLVCQISGGLFQHIYRAFGCCEDGPLFVLQIFKFNQRWHLSLDCFYIFHVCFITMKKSPFSAVEKYLFGHFSKKWATKSTVAPPPSFFETRVSVTNCLQSCGGTLVNNSCTRWNLSRNLWNKSLTQDGHNTNWEKQQT